ncbi:MAG TPA: protein kinase [Nitrolancea sp.]|nr:protein kinase [Nitrolancea sp.]
MLDGHGFDSLIGRSFNGFRVTKMIARGGMGVVFEGVQESLDRSVAIKFLYPHLSDDDRFRERFEREARAAARLSHPNIVRILDYGTDGGIYYMIQDLIVGDSLRERLTDLHKTGSTLRTETVITIIDQVGHALSYAHDHGYVHRDVKPGNVLLTKDGQAYLTDFGVVKLAGSNGLTAAGMIIGTPEYMAPEQSAGAVDIGPAADQYALAVVTYEMLVGRVPFQAPTPAAVMRMHLTDPPPPPSSVVPWFPADIEVVLMRALAKEPFDRYDSIDEFVEALKSAIERARHAAGGTISRRAVSAPTIVDGAAAAAMMTPQPTGGVANTPTGYTPTGATPTGYTPTGFTPTDNPPTGAGQGGGVIGPGGVVASGSGGRSFTPILAIAAIALFAIVLGLGGFIVLNSRSSGNDSNTPTAAVGVAGTSTATGGAAVASATAASTGVAVVADATPTSTAGSVVASATTTAVAAPTAEASAVAAVEAETPPPGETLAILFSSHRGGIHDSEIFIMKPDGSDERQFTAARGHSWGPRISPDGKGFFFSSVAPGAHTIHDASGGSTVGSGNHDVYTADFQGTSFDNMQGVNVNNITAGYTSWDNGWAYSPDSKQIAFTSDRDGNWEIYVMDTDGQNISRLTENPAQDGWPWWTADGKHILFTSDRDGTWQIYIMNPDGSNVQELTHIPDRTNLYPAVSPDGKHVVFSSQVTATNEGDIYIMNLDGSDLQRLTNTAALNNIPSFCPDSQHIVFESDRAGNTDIYMMNLDGTGVTQLTTDPGEDTTASCGYIKTSP